MEPGPSMLLVPFYHDTSRLRPGHMWEDSVTSCLWPGCDHLEPKQRCTLGVILKNKCNIDMQDKMLHNGWHERLGVTQRMR